MVQHIKIADSNFEAAASAFVGNGPDFAFLIDANAFLIAGPGASGAYFNGAGPWTITVNGEMGLLESDFSSD